MKVRSLLKKLKKKKKSTFDGVVNDDAQSSTEDVSTLKSKLRPIKRGNPSSSIGARQEHQPVPAAPASYEHLRENIETSRIRSDVQQLEAKEADIAPSEAPTRSAEAEKSSVGSKKEHTQPFDEFQDDYFGVTSRGTDADGSTWASFGDRSFFNSAQRTGSLFTESTAAETETYSLSSPASSSFGSTISSSQERNSSPDLSVSRTSSSPSPVKEAVESKKSPVSTPRQGRRLPMPESSSLQVGDQRQRASPILSAKKDPSPSPVSFKYAMPSPPPPSQEPVPSPVSKRPSITERYTAALNTSTSSSSGLDTNTPPKPFRARSQKSVLDNHPLYSKRSVVEREAATSVAAVVAAAAVKPQEAEAREEVVISTPSPSKFGGRRSSSSSSSSSPSLDATKAPKLHEAVPVTPSPVKLSLDVDDEPKVEEANVAVEDSMPATFEPSSSVHSIIEANIQATENVLAGGEPSMEQPQPQEEEEKEKAKEPLSRSQSYIDVDMPILSTSPEFDAVPQTAFDAVSTTTSKATTISNQSGRDSDQETAPIGELSFDSRSEHSQGQDDEEEEEEGGDETVDYTYDPSTYTDGMSMLSEDFTDYSNYLHELKKKPSDRFGRWVENTIFGMANFMCPMEEDVYDA